MELLYRSLYDNLGQNSMMISVQIVHGGSYHQKVSSSRTDQKGVSYEEDFYRQSCWKYDCRGGAN